AGAMKYDRLHPHMVVGPDGNPTVFGGASRTETYRVDTNAWEENYAGSQSEAALPAQPRVVLTPDGRFFYAAVGQMSGPAGRRPADPRTAFFQFFDPRHKRWSVSGLAPYGARSGAFVVPLALEPPFDKMTLVTWGGVLGPAPPPGQPANPFTVLTTIDANGNVTNRNGKDLNHPRWSSSGVLLPDGQILAVGGTDKDDAFAPGVGAPVTIPELYNPATDEWTEVAPHVRARGHHHSALLLPDMRVLLGGNDGDPSFEIWSPPYLFRGARPAVLRVQRGVSYGEPFAITTPDAALVESVLLLRTPSPEHGNDSDQRALKLEFTRRSGTMLTATAPPSGTVAPPGTYYLVVNKKSLQGPIPSVARMVEVGRTDLSDAPKPFPDDAPAPAGVPTRATSIDRRWISVAR
ncbi:MAG TPA: galactose oxidase-like domain-containing protein, partial [Acidimicrobiia bacterium]|nr:galactose oxidase-like domain-containing protein [Acidimicrobiia bacterium]